MTLFFSRKSCWTISLLLLFVEHLASYNVLRIPSRLHELIANFVVTHWHGFKIISLKAVPSRFVCGERENMFEMANVNTELYVSHFSIKTSTMINLAVKLDMAHNKLYVQQRATSNFFSVSHWPHVVMPSHWLQDVVFDFIVRINWFVNSCTKIKIE